MKPDVIDVEFSGSAASNESASSDLVMQNPAASLDMGYGRR